MYTRRQRNMLSYHDNKKGEFKTEKQSQTVLNRRDILYFIRRGEWRKRGYSRQVSYRVGRRSWQYLLVTTPVGTAGSLESYKEYICHTHQAVDPVRPYPTIVVFPTALLANPAGMRVCARATSRPSLMYSPNPSIRLIRE